MIGVILKLQSYGLLLCESTVMESSYEEFFARDAFMASGCEGTQAMTMAVASVSSLGFRLSVAPKGMAIGLQKTANLNDFRPSSSAFFSRLVNCAIRCIFLRSRMTKVHSWAVVAFCTCVFQQWCHGRQRGAV